MKNGRIAYFVFKIIGTSSQFCLLVSAVDVKGPIKVQLKGFLFFCYGAICFPHTGMFSFSHRECINLQNE